MTMPMAAGPAVTVIALCYNHARFLLECLDSIDAQTCRDFQLIVTDDCSQDGSADMIAAWIAARRPDTVFIRHQKNAGLCSTLNEALAQARGEFISMIATDDVWESDKIAVQLAAARQCANDVAVIYSDASQIDVAGIRLPKNFMEDHRPGRPAPTGAVFSALADGNFIPAMATLIRRSAIAAVGGYDERLTYEDYDMWLRLAARYQFLFCPGAPARYRIVASSMVRTTFVQPSARHYWTQFLIREKFLTSTLLNPAQRAKWSANQADAAYGLYVLGDERAGKALWSAAKRSRRPRLALLAAANSIGISRAGAKRMLSMFRPSGG
jgi:glycosyltransferase involved in cell wall biosynthesis